MSSTRLWTFVFTDIVDSTGLLNRMPGGDMLEKGNAYKHQILLPHRARIEPLLAKHGGQIDTREGDGYFLIFDDPIGATLFAVEACQSHEQDHIPTPEGGHMKIRVGIHMGHAVYDQKDGFVGAPINYTKRLSTLAEPGKIIVSASVAHLVQDRGFKGITSRLVGERELKGFGKKRVFEIVQEDEDAEGREAGFVTEIAGYPLLEKLGSGGMGDVFKTHHDRLDRDCVIKVIKNDLLADESAVERFYQEVRAAGRLNHHSVVTALDASKPDTGKHFLVMEYIDGKSLGQILKSRGRLNVADACEIAIHAAEGLQYIHEQGLVHRDIKPSNIMLSPHQVGDRVRVDVKILDLGLAMLRRDKQERLTATSAKGMGTEMYMAPEQWQSPASVDIRADIYGLGCTLYHMLAGDPPFEQSKLKPEHAHLEEPIPELRQDVVPDAVWDVLQHMLAKDPNERFAEPVEVIEALMQFTEQADLAALFDDNNATTRTKLLEPDTGRGSAGSQSGGARGTRGTRNRSNWLRTRDDDSTGRRLLPIPKLSRRTVIVGTLLTAIVSLGAWFLLKPTAVKNSSYDHEAMCRLGGAIGLNGAWWFDEFSWFAPPIRAAVLNDLTTSEYLELKQLAGESNVDAFYKRLKEISKRVAKKRGLSPLFIRLDVLAGDATWQHKESGLKEDLIGRDVALTSVEPDALDAMHWHVLGAVAANNVKFEADADSRALKQAEAEFALKQARRQYEADDELAGLPSSFRDSLLALCVSDLASISIEAKKYGEARSLFGEAAMIAKQCPQPAHPLTLYCRGMQLDAALFEVLFQNGDVTLRDMREWIDEARDAAELLVGPDHPLRAWQLERAARFHLEYWELDEAIKAGREAARIRDLTGRVVDIANGKVNAYDVARSAYHSQEYYFRAKQFEGMALHFRGRNVEATTVFTELVNVVSARTKFGLTRDQEDTWERLEPNLRGRLADCYLFAYDPDLKMRDPELVLRRPNLAGGNPAAAAEQLASAVASAEQMGWDTTPLKPYVVRLLSKEVIARVLAGEKVIAANVLDQAQAWAVGVPEARQTVYQTFVEVAQVLVNDQEKAEELIRIIKEATERDEDLKTMDRDNRQILLFICQYLLEGVHGLTAPQRQQVEDFSDRLLAEPEKQTNMGTYMKHMRDAVVRILQTRGR